MEMICIVKWLNKYKMLEVVVEILGFLLKMVLMNIIKSLLKIRKDVFEFNEKNCELLNML